MFVVVVRNEIGDGVWWREFLLCMDGGIQVCLLRGKLGKGKEEAVYKMMSGVKEA